MHERCFNAGEIYNIFFMLFSKKCWKQLKKCGNDGWLDDSSNAMRYKRYAPACPLAFPSSSLVHLLPCFAEEVSHLPICPLVARLPACWRKSRPVSSLLLTAHPPTLPSPSPPKSTSPTKVTKHPSVKVIKWPSASNCTTSDHALNCWNTGWSQGDPWLNT